MAVDPCICRTASISDFAWTAYLRDGDRYFTISSWGSHLTDWFNTGREGFKDVASQKCSFCIWKNGFPQASNWALFKQENRAQNSKLMTCVHLLVGHAWLSSPWNTGSSRILCLKTDFSYIKRPFSYSCKDLFWFEGQKLLIIFCYHMHISRQHEFLEMEYRIHQVNWAAETFVREEREGLCVPFKREGWVSSWSIISGF